jgi:hypothetical protein
MRVTNALALASLLGSTASAAVTFDDGLVHIIDATNSPLDTVQVRSSTTVVVDAGGFISNLSVNDYSLVTMLDGEVGVFHIDGAPHFAADIRSGRIGELSTHGDSASSILLTGGEIGFIDHVSSGMLDMNGGTVLGDVRVFGGFDRPSARISGGVIEGDLVGFDNSGGRFGLWISGGQFNGDISILGGMNAEIAGGEFEGNSILVGDAVFDPFGPRLMIAGGRFALNELTIDSYGVLTIAGSDFNFPLGDVTAETGTITGTLMDGSLFSVDFARLNTRTNAVPGKITLVPEPSTGALCAIGLVALTVAKRRSRAR